MIVLLWEIELGVCVDSPSFQTSQITQLDISVKQSCYFSSSLSLPPFLSLALFLSLSRTNNHFLSGTPLTHHERCCADLYLNIMSQSSKIYMISSSFPELISPCKYVCVCERKRHERGCKWESEIMNTLSEMLY